MVLAHILETSSALRKQIQQHVTKASKKLGPADIEAVSRGYWPLLAHFSLSNLSLDNAAFANLASMPQQQLQSLDLWRVSWPASHFTCAFLGPSLTSLRLTHSKLEPSSLLHLAAADLPLLESLDLSNSLSSSEAMSYLSQASWPNLKMLNLSHNDLGNAGICSLAGAQWPLLEDLRLSETGFDGKIIDKLFSGNWPRLLRLNISNNHFTNGSPEPNAEPAWPLMQHLNMSATIPFVGTLPQLFKVKWSQLQSVDLHGNRLPIAAVKPWYKQDGTMSVL